MLKTTAVALAATMIAGSALAADLPSRKAPYLAPPVPILTWNGLYIGLNAGARFNSSNNASLASFATGDISPGIASGAALAATGIVPLQRRTSFLGGGQFGTNYQFGNVVLGTEVDIQGITPSSSYGALFGAAPTPAVAGGAAFTTAAVSRRLSFLNTDRVRVGYLFTPTLLVYGTGGLAYGRTVSSTTISGAYTFPGAGSLPIAGFSNNSVNRAGYAFGGGVEWMFLPNWSAKAEYLYYDLGRSTYQTATSTSFGGFSLATASATQVRFNGQIARAGINYHFTPGTIGQLFGGL